MDMVTNQLLVGMFYVHVHGHKPTTDMHVYIDEHGHKPDIYMNV